MIQMTFAIEVKKENRNARTKVKIIYIILLRKTLYHFNIAFQTHCRNV